MPGSGYHPQLRVFDALAEDIGAGNVQHAVLLAPDNQGGRFDAGKPLLERRVIALHLSKNSGRLGGVADGMVGQKPEHRLGKVWPFGEYLVQKPVKFRDRSCNQPVVTGGCGERELAWHWLSYAVRCNESECDHLFRIMGGIG